MAVLDGPSTLDYCKERVDLLTIAMDKLEAAINQRFTALDERFKHIEQLGTLSQDNTKRAVDKAESAQHAHNVAANEWRGTLNDFKGTLISKSEFDRVYAEFNAHKLETARLLAAMTSAAAAKQETKAEAKGDSKWWIALIVAAVPGVIALVALLLRHAP